MLTFFVFSVLEQLKQKRRESMAKRQEAEAAKPVEGKMFRKKMFEHTQPHL